MSKLKQSNEGKGNKPVPIILGLAIFVSFACNELAGPPEEMFQSVTAVEFQDEIVYAAEIYTKGYEDYPAAWSKDGGTFWNHY